jgi:hypothetical protein
MNGNDANARPIQPWAGVVQEDILVFAYLSAPRQIAFPMGHKYDLQPEGNVPRCRPGGTDDEYECRHARLATTSAQFQADPLSSRAADSFSRR